MKKKFTIYPFITVSSCKSCPFQNGAECTFTGGPTFKDNTPPTVIHNECPKAESEKS